ncbi:anti-sigma factor [Gaiella sp.]|uniref:anti-sigma factor n=1 Tax=Gaiella sp. TaxID=2663207 RepID=UPI00326436E1
MSDEQGQEFEDDRVTIASVEQSLPRVVPPVDMFDRILAEIRPEATVVPLQPRVHRRVVVPVVGTLAAIAAVVLIAVVALGGDEPGTPDARAAIAGKSDPAVSGEALLFGSDADGGTVQVTLRDVPAAPSGHHYEVWVLREEGGGEMESVGVFIPTSGDVDLELQLPGPGNYAAVDVSVEEDGGPSIHSDTSLAGGSFS